MNVQVFLRNLAVHIPPDIGKFLAWIPYSWRLGGEYTRMQKLIRNHLRMPVEAQKLWLMKQMRTAFIRAYEENLFYRNFCKKAGFDPASIVHLQDIERAPLLKKQDLQAVPIELRSTYRRGRILTNTGGSSGQPLAFYLDRHAFAREWAHLHHYWFQAGYRPDYLKLTFRGKNLGRNALRYNAVYHEYYANVYLPPDATARALKPIAGHIQCIHGYPSAIYAFVRHCAASNRPVLDLLRKNLRCILLASEYPAPVYRDLIEGELGMRAYSWYGHSEMAVFACETEPFVYAPMQTYGYAEAAPNGSGGFHLAGSSYWNTVTPFLRYDCEDCIDPEFDHGMLARFRIKSGRQGEFIEDAQGNPISLTALIFGRHHKLFGRADFIQVRPDGPGKATVLVTISHNADSGGDVAADVAKDFDASHVAIEFAFEIRREPVRTPAGKVPLLVPAGEHAR